MNAFKDGHELKDGHEHDKCSPGPEGCVVDPPRLKTLMTEDQTRPCERGRYWDVQQLIKEEPIRVTADLTDGYITLEQNGQKVVLYRGDSRPLIEIILEAEKFLTEES